MRDERYAAALEQIRAFAEQQLRENGAPGYQIALTDRDGLIAHLELGCANIDSRAPILPETLFEFGSIGKSFTAICYLQLAEAGRVDLHAPITEYLPWFSVQSVYEPVTIHHLLTHTAGIIGGTDFTPGQEFEVWSLRNTTTGTPPGTFFHYSNIGYKALGLALERIEGKPYAAIIKERIFDPLGMTNASAVIDATIRPRLAVGYQPEFDDRPRLPAHGLVPAPWLETNTADGCLSASATDLAIYLRMLLNRGAFPGGRLISEESFRLMTTSHIDTADGGGYGYGYALAIQVDPATGAFGHGGGMVGYVSSMEGNLDSGLGAVVFTNSMNATAPVALYALKALAAVQSGEEVPLLPEPEHQPIGDFVGIYRNRKSTVEFVERDGNLHMHLDGTTATLVKAMHYPDRFVHDIEDRRHFPYRFERDADGTVTGVVHGPTRWLRKSKSGDDTAIPEIWRAYAGHYRSYDPWESNFRVVIREGSLILIWPQGAEDELIPAGDGFRIGADPRIPERLWFDTIIDGQALQARDSPGSTYHRFFTQ
jgi:CubicO group peptidase (beta-lactamase class C family)